MSDRTTLIKWFDQLGEERKDLPYELTKLFSDQENQELLSSVNLAFDHVERVFGFCRLLEHGKEPADELWSYLQAIVDDSSYYACLALPLIRQLLEPSVKFVYSGNDAGDRSSKLDESAVPVPESADSLPTAKRLIFNDAWMVAQLLSRDADSYEQLTSADELVAWSKKFLGSCSRLLLVSSQLSQLLDEPNL